METSIWERVLINWVNCLKLSKPIQKLEDLKDGIFLDNLQKVMKKSSEKELDGLTSLLNTLRHQYPKVSISNDTFHINDIALSDLLTVTSLLMHYTCIFDRRDVLTSPLCHNLQQTTQVVIKDYLEKVQECSELTNETLSHIIHTCVKNTEENITDKSQHWFSLPSYLDTKHSPLQELLKTPTTKSSRLLEKDKEIAKLKTSLELVSEEKENVEEDLKLQIERNKRLEQQLSQKTVEISRLRSEVLFLEERTPPHYQDRDSRETQKILRAKVESLEQIVEQCEKENDELRIQRDAEKAQVKVLEAQCKTWLEKFMETDKKLQNLKEHSKEQELKFENLKVHCDELELLLEELKPKTFNESLTDDSFRSTTNRRSKNFELVSSYEDLAHSVIDIQLKDQQKENEELKMSLKKARDIEYNLKTKNDELTNELKILVKEKIDLVDLLKNRDEKIIILIREHDDLKEQFDRIVEINENMTQSLTELKKEYDKLQSTLIETQQESLKLQDSVKKLTFCNEELIISKQNLIKQNSELKFSIQIISAKLDAVTSEKKSIIEENCTISNRLKISLEESQELKSCLADLRKNLKILEQNISNSILERGQIVAEKQKYLSLFEDSNEKLNKCMKERDIANQINDHLTEQFENVCGDLQKCQYNFCVITNDLKSLKTDFEKLNTENKIIIEEKNKIFQDLQNLTTNYESLKIEKEKISTEKEILIEKESNLFKNYELLKYEFEKINAENKITLQKHNYLLQDFQSVTTDYELLKIELEKIDAENKIIKEEKNNIFFDFQNLKKDYESLQIEFEKVIAQSKIIIEEKDVLFKDFQTFKIDYDTLKVEVLKIDNENKLTREEKNNIFADYQNIKTDYESLQIEFEKVTAQSKITIEEKNVLFSDFQNIKTDYKLLQIECDKLNAENKTLIEDKNNTFENLQKISIDYDSIKIKIEKYDEQIKLMNEKNYDLEEQLKKMTNDNHKLQFDFEEITNDNRKLLEEKNAELITLENNYQLLKNAFEEIDIKNKLLLQKNSNINKELKDLMNNYQFQKNELKKKNDAYQLVLEEKNDLSKKLKSSLNVHEELKQNQMILQQTYDNLKLENVALYKENEQYQLDKQIVLEKLNVINWELDLFWKLVSNSINADNFDIQFSPIIDNINNSKSFVITELLPEITKKIQDLKEKSNSLIKDYNLVLVKSQDLEKEKQAMCEIQQELKISLDCIIEKKGQVENNLHKITTDKNLLEEENHELKEELYNLNKVLKKQEIDLLALREQINNLEMKYVNTVTNNDKLQSDLNCIIADKNNINNLLEIVTNEKQQLQDNNIQLLEELKNVAEEKTILLEKLEEVVNSRETLSENYSQLQNEKMKLSENYEILLFKNNCCVQNLEDISKELKRVHSEKHIIIQRINKVSLIYNHMIRKNKQLHFENCNLLQKLQHKINKNKEIYHVLKSLQKDVQEDSINENIQTLNKIKLNNIQHLNDQTETLGWEILINIFSNLKNLLMERNDLITQLQSLQEGNNELHSNVNKLCGEKSEIENQLSALLNEKKIVVQELNLVKNNEDQLIQKNNYLNEQISNMHIEKIKFQQMLNIKEQEKTIKIEEINQEKKNLIEKLEKINEEKNVINNSLDLSNEKLQEILKENKNIIFENETIKEKFKELTVEMDNITKKSKVSQDEFNKKISTLYSKLVETSKSLQIKIKELETMSYEKEQVCEQLNKLILECKENNRESEDRFKKLNEEKIVISKFLDLNNSELQTVLEKKEKLLEALEMSNKEVHNLIQEKHDFQNQIQQISQSLNTSKFEIDNLNKEKHILLDQITELEIKLTKVISEQINMSEKFEILIQEKAKLFEQLDAVCQEKVNISEELQVIHSQSYKAFDLLNRVHDLSEENARLVVQTTSLQNDLEAKTKEVQLLGVSNKHLKKMTEEKAQILNKISQENQDVFEVVDRISQEKSEMAQSLELALKELEKRTDEKNQLAQALNDTTRELESLSKENHILINSLATKKKDLEIMKQERNELLESQTKIMKETEKNILLAHDSALELKKDLLKRIEMIESEKTNLKKQYEDDLKKLREAYASVVSINSKFELENVNLRKKIEDNNMQMSDFEQIKEAYEKLLEENNKLMTEVDTVKYKRSRDREEMLNILKKDRENAYIRETKKIREVRNEYEGKLEKMKEKMLKLYRDEVNKEMQKVKTGQDESNFLQKTVEDLRNQLFEAEQKVHILETERDMLRYKDFQVQRNMLSSRESLLSLRDKDRLLTVRDSISSLRSLGNEIGIKNKPNCVQLIRKDHSISSSNIPFEKDLRIKSDKPQSTVVPRGCVTEIEEKLTISRRTSINGIPTNIGDLEMEDEDDDFNNKYLADLKSGKCTVSNVGQESNINRFSELAWRNSLVPPHLKSSYPAEMQFISPTHFKEDDIKAGNVELDDSLCKLLPGEKPRQKKDFGTTSYKKPGPPTPSKNGGRLSLQGNEIRPLSECNERTPKKATPSRIKSLFMGRTSQKENLETQCVTPRTNKRLNIFRKQK